MPDFPVPVKIVMKNFCSHDNNVVEFGNPSEKIFIRGETGQGKSHIFNAIKFALGKKKENDEEVFTYDEVLENNEKKKVFRNESQIILTLKNSGTNPLKQFPPDAEFCIEANFVRGKRTRYYLIQPEGKSKSLISREDLAQFGRHDDPLLFVDQAQTSIWTQMYAEERFKRISSLIGIEDHQKKVKETLQALAHADKQLTEHNSKYEIAKVQFAEIEKLYKRFQDKAELNIKLQALQKQLILSSMWDAFDLHLTQEENLNQCDSQIQTHLSKKKAYESEIESIQSEIEKYDNTLAEISKGKPKLEEERDSKLVRIKNFESQLAACNQTLAKYKINSRDFLANEISTELLKAIDNLNEINDQKSSLNVQLHQIKTQLDKITQNSPSLFKDIEILTNKLIKAKIPYELVFSVIDIQPKEEKWRDIVEAYLDWDKRAIIVEPNNRIAAEKINRDNNLDAVILAPRKDNLRMKQNLTNFKTWEDILQILPGQIKENTIKQILDYLLRGVFFAETHQEKETILNTTKGQVLCFDKYKYDSFSQRRIRRPRDYMVGKNAKKLETSRLETQISELTKLIADLEEQKNLAEENVEKLRNLASYFSLQNQLPQIEYFRKELDDIKAQLETIVIKMANPQEYKEKITRKLGDQKELLNRTSNDLGDKRNDFKQIQLELTQTSTQFQIKFNEIHDNPQNFVDFVDPSFNSTQISEYLITYEDVQISYKGLKKELLELKKLFKMPEDKTEIISKNILINESQLKGYSDVPADTLENYQKLKGTLEQYEKELENFTNEYDRCDIQFTEAHDTLKDRLDKWKRDVNKNFSKVMQKLQLDGELNFEDLDGQGAFGLNFNVANSVGGAKSLIEKANFSGGEKQRTNIAFIVSIIIQTQYTYLIWDEPDSAIGEPYREMLAKVIENFFPYRKLILASPQRIVQGYIKVFDQIIEVFKDGKNRSHITKVLLTDEYQKDKGVLDVKNPPKV